MDELLAKKKARISVDADPRLQSYTRTTICDAQGNFSLAGLPEQRWHVLTGVTWEVSHIGEAGAQPETNLQGGELMQAVTLTPGDNGADTVTIIEGDLNPGQFAKCRRVLGSHEAGLEVLSSVPQKLLDAAG